MGREPPGQGQHIRSGITSRPEKVFQKPGNATIRIKTPKRRFIRSGRFYVYIVECADGTYYTGYTPRLKNRIKLHNAGRGAKYTRQHGPVKLVWYKRYRYFKVAFKREMAIKKLTRAAKERLINA